MTHVALHHGTDVTAAHELNARGVDATAAARYNVTGEFWATTDSTTADWFARTNPAGGPPARFSFAIPESVLRDLLAQNLVMENVQSATQIDYEFLPGSFVVLNAHLTARQVILLP
jgi:hypothetical protein